MATIITMEDVLYNRHVLLGFADKLDIPNTIEGNDFKKQLEMYKQRNTASNYYSMEILRKGFNEYLKKE